MNFIFAVEILELLCSLHFCHGNNQNGGQRGWGRGGGGGGGGGGCGIFDEILWCSVKTSGVTMITVQTNNEDLYVVT